MSQMQLASRYAKALFEVAQEAQTTDEVFSELASLSTTLFSKENLEEFFSSPLIRPAQKEEAIEKALSGAKTSETLKKFSLLLAKKNRLAIFPEIVKAFQIIADKSKGVVRGIVKSPKALGKEEQATLQSRIEAVTQQKAFLDFEVEPSLIGGLTAEVGNYTFDDSLSGHITRMKEQLNRSTN